MSRFVLSGGEEEIKGHLNLLEGMGVHSYDGHALHQSFLIN